jgi:hypothetical protein
LDGNLENSQTARDNSLKTVCPHQAGMPCPIQQPEMTKKLRTRQHIIANLSVNYVERFAYLCGYSVERVNQDYGIDLIIFTYDSNGEIENGSIYIQLKATDSMKVLVDQETISYSLQRADLDLWLKEPLPYILIVYDAHKDVAYWLYLQAYFEQQTDFDLTQIGQTVTVHLQTQNRLDQEAMRKFGFYKQEILRQCQGVIHHRA